jgi:DNA invertase Pin-like site-specific DNA recombinase
MAVGLPTIQEAARAPKGRPRALSEQEVAEAQKLYWEECLPVRAIADALSVSHMTVWRAVCPPQLAAGREN